MSGWDLEKLIISNPRVVSGSFCLTMSASMVEAKCRAWPVMSSAVW